MKIKKGVISALALALIVLTARAEAAAPGDLLTPGGEAVVLELNTEGMLVAGLATVETETGAVSPAGEAGLKPGDRIVRINGVSVPNAAAFGEAVSALGGEAVHITAERQGHPAEFTLTPALGKDGGRYLGLWLRDGISGIGTLTFRDPKSGLYGALGHGVSASAGSEQLTPVTGGTLAPAHINEVVAGEHGKPGELVGSCAGAVLGDVRLNSPAGVFGLSSVLSEREPLVAASDREIRLGTATILSTVNGDEPREYSVEITRIVRGGDELRSLSLCVTDAELLQSAGGIVQGMSGSPILQDGKLIGAVTHVLVEDPTRGYGVTIETMLNAASSLPDD